MLCISGVSAEEIDVDSSVVAECPISAELDNSLSSYDASYNELSSYESYEVSDCEGFEYSSESLPSTDEVSYEYDSFDSSYGQMSFEPSDSFETYDVYIIWGYVESSDCYDSQVPCGSLELDNSGTIDAGDSITYESQDVYCVGEITPILGAVDNTVIVDDCNDDFDDVYIVIMSMKGLLENLNSLTRYGEISDNLNSIISRVADDVEASESNKFSIDVNPQVNDLLRFENDCDVLDIYALDLQEISETSEPVFDSILVTSGYISPEEVYFGSISDSDREMLLKYVGADDLFLFASSAIDWNSSVTFDILKNVALNQQIDEINLAGYKFTKALLKYYPLADEIHISLVGDNEDEHSHVINDTNSHGLDYAYIKHVNVIYKDMPNLIVLTSSGYASNSKTTKGSWDGLNDVLGYSMSSKTLLPDHKAIWTPLLLLKQQDLQESIVNSHADDNGKEKVNNTKHISSNNNCKCKKCNSSNCTCKNCKCNKTKCNCKHGHHGGGGNHHYWHGGYNGYDAGYCQVVSAGNVTSDLNKNDNSTDDKNKSGNVTTAGKKGGPIESPKTTLNGEQPTYTLVYAIIGIVLVSLLFNSSYMKRD